MASAIGTGREEAEAAPPPDGVDAAGTPWRLQPLALDERKRRRCLRPTAWTPPATP